MSGLNTRFSRRPRPLPRTRSDAPSHRRPSPRLRAAVAGGPYSARHPPPPTKRRAGPCRSPTTGPQPPDDPSQYPEGLHSSRSRGTGEGQTETVGRHGRNRDRHDATVRMKNVKVIAIHTEDGQSQTPSYPRGQERHPRPRRDGRKRLVIVLEDRAKHSEPAEDQEGGGAGRRSNSCNGGTQLSFRSCSACSRSPRDGNRGVLGVDNIIFLAIVAGKVRRAQQPKTRRARAPRRARHAWLALLPRLALPAVEVDRPRCSRMPTLGIINDIEGTLEVSSARRRLLLIWRRPVPRPAEDAPSRIHERARSTARGRARRQGRPGGQASRELTLDHRHHSGHRHCVLARFGHHRRSVWWKSCG